MWTFNLNGTFDVKFSRELRMKKLFHKILSKNLLSLNFPREMMILITWKSFLEPVVCVCVWGEIQFRVPLTTENLFRSSNWVMYSRLNVHEIVLCVYFVSFHFISSVAGDEKFVQKNFPSKPTEPPDSKFDNERIFSWKLRHPLEGFTLREERLPSEWKLLPSNPSHEPASEVYTISIRLSSEGGNDEKIQFNVQLKFPSIFYLRLPSHCAKDGHSFFHLYDYEYKWVRFLWGLSVEGDGMTWIEWDFPFSFFYLRLRWRKKMKICNDEKSLHQR